MSTEILLALVVLAATILLLVTGLLRSDLIALLVLVVVAILGLVPPQRALAGFASAAVLTVAGMYVISAGLSRTGVAEVLGQWILRVAGNGEVRVMVAVTLVSGIISGVMTNVGVAAMMLPVVVGIARRAAIPPSKLLIPMVLGTQMGGLLTLVGSTPNLLAADALRSAGFEPFGLFSFTPIGIVILAAGTLLIATVGPRLLPTREPRRPVGEVDRSGIRDDVELSERLFYLKVPRQSLLTGKTLAESLIDSALGVHVLALLREGRTIRAPGPETTLRGGDRVLVQGRPDFFLELRGRRHLAGRGGAMNPEWLESPEVGLARARVARRSAFVGRSPAELDLRARRGILVLTLVRDDAFRRTHIVDTPMQVGDELLLQGPRDKLAELAAGSDVEGLEPLTATAAVREFELEERLWRLRVTPHSLMAGRTLAETRLGDAAGLTVLAVASDPSGEGGADTGGEGGAETDDDGGSDTDWDAGADSGEDAGAPTVGDGPAGGWRVRLLPGPDLRLEVGDHLLVKARPDDMIVLRGLQRLEVDLDTPVDAGLLEGADAGFTEAVLAPRSSLVGRTLRQVNFRGRFGMHVVGIVREGGVIRAELRDEVLKFGDALLLYGPRRNQRALAREPDLILLRLPEGDEPEPRLAPLSILITVGSLLPVMFGLVPVAVGILGGAALMVLTGCLSTDDAYGAIEWPTLVLIAGMLALGAALDETGAVVLFGEALLDGVGGLGAPLMLAVLVAVSALAGQFIPSTVVVVLMAPVALAAGDFLGVSPYPLVMGVAIAATTLASPVSHPAPALVMAPAGYRRADFLRLGVPLTLLVAVLTILVTPLFFPF
jgi:di/tricarboxylate transporter